MHITCQGESHLILATPGIGIYGGARASWHGTRIVLRQTSPEAIAIFDWIISLQHRCHGDWKNFGQELGIANSEMTDFLNYAACFLSNVGDYYVSWFSFRYVRIAQNQAGFRRSKVCA